jgi:hypothetical protein
MNTSGYKNMILVRINSHQFRPGKGRKYEKKVMDSGSAFNLGANFSVIPGGMRRSANINLTNYVVEWDDDYKYFCFELNTGISQRS